MIDKMKLIAASLLASLPMQGYCQQTACYGYGNIMGSPSNYLEDDYDVVVQLGVGQNGVHVSYIDYLFEGKNLIQLGYGKVSEENYKESSYQHGQKSNVQAKRYNLRNASSRILSPGFVKNTSLDSLIAFFFVEYFTAEDDNPAYVQESAPWVLTAFEAQQRPYYKFVDDVHLTLRSDETYQWQVNDRKLTC